MEAPRYQRILYHASVFSVYFYSSIYYWKLKIPRRPGYEFAGHFKYLTYWNLLLHCLFHGLALFHDISNQRSVKRFIDQLFTSLALPLGLFVPSVFWGLYAVDRELILPKILDKYYPLWLNHVSHTLILPTTLLECHLCYRPHLSRRNGIIKLILFIGLYLAWVLFLGIYKNVWVYPVLEVLDWPSRVIFIILCSIFLSALYLIGEYVSKKMRGASVRGDVKFR